MSIKRVIFFIIFGFNILFGYSLQQSEDINLVLSKSDLDIVAVLKDLKFTKHNIYKSSAIKRPSLIFKNSNSKDGYDSLLKMYGLKTEFIPLHLTNDKNLYSYSNYIAIKPVSYPKSININYYGTDIGITFDVYMVDNIDKTLFNKNKFIDIYKFFASTEYVSLINQIKNLQNKLILNGWGTYDLVDRISKKIYSSYSFQSYFKWFIMIKLGYDFRLAYDQNGNYHTMVVSKSFSSDYVKNIFVKVDNKKYYLLNGYKKDLKLLYTYDNNLNLNEIDMDIKNYPNFNTKEILTRVVDFKSLDNIDYSVTINGNKNIIKYFNEYPQLEYKNYFDVDLSNFTKDSLNIFFTRLYNSSNNDIDFINNILKFVQYFDYDSSVKEDNKINFLENILFIKNNNVYNKNLLFSYLVSHFLDINIIVLVYERGYVLTGINFKDKMIDILNSSSISVYNYYGNSYILLDPYLKNSKIGTINTDKLGRIKKVYRIKLK